MANLRDYESITGPEAVNQILELGERLSGSRIVHISSTRSGGGVAEILTNLIPLLNQAGPKTEWKVIEGDQEFFKTTKTIHNMLHGTDGQISREMIEHYLAVNKRNASTLEDLNEADFVVVHDPQVAPLIDHFPRRRGKWIWRCHIDLSSPNIEAWNLIVKFVAQYDATIFHVEKFARKDIPNRQFIVPPAIDPVDQKNRELLKDEIDRVLEKHHINPRKQMISQIGRFDRLKDLEGVVEVYHHLRNARREYSNPVLNIISERIDGRQIDCQLVIAGGLADDDPDGREVYRDVLKRVGRDKNAKVVLLPPNADLDVNAIQRHSNVILQKSLKEGFALTVAEALWKGTPVIGGNTGGIPLQVLHGIDGFLVNNVEEAEAYTRFLLRSPKKAKEMGSAGKEHVRRNFLVTRYVRDHLLVYLTLQQIPGKLVQL